MPVHATVTGGFVPPTQLGSGTPDGTKFLRDDGVWAVPAAGGLPAGLICMWHGLLANIPTGWVLCDGGNGTPDLRSKFVKGAAAGVDPGATGGAATHTHANHASHTHTYSQIVNHTHPVTDPGHNHTQNSHNHTQDAHNHTQNAHNHVITSQTATTGSATSYEHGALDTSSAEAEATEVTANTTATNQAATATNQAATATNISNTTGITTSNPAGGVAQGTSDGPGAALTHDTVNSEPAYYCVAYIMKT